MDNREREELLKAREALRRQLQILRTPAHSFGSRELPARLLAQLKEINMLLAEDKEASGGTTLPSSPSTRR